VTRRSSRVGTRGAAARQGVTTLVDQAIVSSTNFLTAVIVARGASAGELGLYSLGFGVVVLLACVQGALVSIPYNVYAMRVPAEERRAYTGSTLVHHLCVSGASAALLAAAGLLLAGRSVPGVAAVVSMLAVAVPFTLAREYGRQLLFSNLRYASALLLDAAVAAVQLGLLLALARDARLSAAAAYGAIAAACALAVALFAAMARRLFQLAPRRILPTFRMNWATGRWSLAAGVAAVASAQLYPWFTAATRGPDEAGVLAACFGITALANPLLIGTGNFLAPQIMHAYARGGLRAVQRVTRLALVAVTAAMALLCLLLFLAGGALLGFVFGPRFAPHGLAVGVLSLSLVADWLSLPAHYALFFMDRARVMFKCSAIVLATTVLVGFALVSALGAMGAAIGLLVGHSLATAFKWREYRRRVASVDPAELDAAAAAYGAGA
jgi:O-antigen/teichoic acid export membrane protein